MPPMKHIILILNPQRTRRCIHFRRQRPNQEPGTLRLIIRVDCGASEEWLIEGVGVVRDADVLQVRHDRRVGAVEV